MPCRRTAIDEYRRVAGNNDSRAAMTFFGAGDFVTDACDALADGIGCGGAADDRSAMTGYVANYD